MEEKEIGTVTHYFSHLGVAAIQLQGELRVGDTIRIKGHTTDFQQSVESMQIEHEFVQQAGAGQNIGIRVVEHTREHDHVYKLVG